MGQDDSSKPVFSLDPNEVKRACSQLLGSGQFAKVYIGVLRDELVAIKVQQIKNAELEKYLLQEISILQDTRHPNLLGYRGAARADKVAYIVTSYAPGGDLRQFLQRNAKEAQHWPMRVQILMDIAKALVSLHARGLMHRDLKTSNVILDECCRAIVCDFGLATRHKKDPHMTICGTDEFMAPEVAFGIGYRTPADIFSFGILAAEVVTRRAPGPDFLHRAPQDGFLFDESQLRGIFPSDTPVSLVELIVQCVAGEPDTRPSAPDIQDWLVALLDSITKKGEEWPVYRVAPAQTSRDLTLSTIHHHIVETHHDLRTVGASTDLFPRHVIASQSFTHLSSASSFGPTPPTPTTPTPTPPTTTPSPRRPLSSGPSPGLRRVHSVASNTTHFSVMQWNILAAGLSASPVTAPPFAAVQSSNLGGFLATPHPHLLIEFEKRRWRILEEMVQQQADIVCVQECDHFADFFKPALHQLGYASLFQPKPFSPCLRFGYYSDGCAIFWNLRKFGLLSCEMKPGCVIAQLTHHVTSQHVICASTHLKAGAGADNELVRCSQVRWLLTAIDDMAASSMISHVILTGDFNVDARDSPPCIDHVIKNHSPPFRSAYPLPISRADPSFTSWKIREREEKWVSDYIFCSPSLTVVSHLAVPSAQLVPECRLPCIGCPSDHLSLVASFAFSSPRSQSISGRFVASRDTSLADTAADSPPHATATPQLQVEAQAQAPHHHLPLLHRHLPLVTPHRLAGAIGVVVLALLLVAIAESRWLDVATHSSPVCWNLDLEPVTCLRSHRLSIGLWRQCHTSNHISVCYRYYGHSRIGNCSQLVSMDELYCHGLSVCGQYQAPLANDRSLCGVRKLCSAMVVLAITCVVAVVTLAHWPQRLSSSAVLVALNTALSVCVFIAVVAIGAVSHLLADTPAYRTIELGPAFYAALAALLLTVGCVGLLLRMPNAPVPKPRGSHLGPHPYPVAMPSFDDAEP